MSSFGIQGSSCSPWCSGKSSSPSPSGSCTIFCDSTSGIVSFEWESGSRITTGGCGCSSSSWVIRRTTLRKVSLNLVFTVKHGEGDASSSLLECSVLMTDVLLWNSKVFILCLHPYWHVHFSGILLGGFSYHGCLLLRWLVLGRCLSDDWQLHVFFFGWFGHSEFSPSS